MNANDWGVEICHAEGGYTVKDNEGVRYAISGEDADIDLLWFLIDFFNMRPSRYSRERIYVDKEVGDKYTLKADEKRVYYSDHPKVVKKGAEEEE